MTYTAPYQITMLKKIREYVLSAIKDLNATQLNHIPEGFNNNIIWNAAHLIAAQQGICYLRSGQQAPVSDEFIQAYKPGSKPEAVVTEEEIENIKGMLMSTIDQFETDLRAGKFSNYTPWTSRYGLDVNHIEDALNMLAFHEGCHFGYILALKRVL